MILGSARRHEPEHRAFGYPFDHQIGRFEEALGIITTLLREGQVDFEGTYYTARECELRPRGPRPDGPPILIGALGTGPRMLRLTARYADLWNAWLTWGGALPTRCRHSERSWMTPAGRLVAIRHTAPDRDRSRRGSRSAAALGVDFHRRGAASPSAVHRTGSPTSYAASLARGSIMSKIVHAPSTVAGIEAFAPVLERLDQG